MPAKRPCLSAAFIISVFTVIVSAQPPWCPDLTQDNFVNFPDFSIMGQNWLESGPSLPGDFVQNDLVDLNDLSYFSHWWLHNCGDPPFEYLLGLGLEHYWPLDENDTNYVFVDKVGQADLWCNAPTNVVSVVGKIGNAYAGYMQWGPDHNDLMTEDNALAHLWPLSKLTLAFWFKLPTTPSENEHCLMRMGGMVFLVDNEAGTIEFRIFNEGGYYESAETSDYGDNYWADNVWHLLVATFDNSLDIANMKLYIDNNLEDSNDCSVYPYSYYLDLHVNPDSIPPFEMRVDEIAYWSISLTEMEIGWIWNNGNGISLPVE